MIVCLEGGDASGKATQASILANKLDAALYSFPDYTTPTGKAIFHNLTMVPGPRLDKRNALVLQSLMTMNRMEKGANLQEAARRGHVVLDRYDASGIVHGTIDGLDPEWVRKTNAQLSVRPDLYILLDVPVDEGFRRRPERRDRYERDRSYMERVREEYLRLFVQEQKVRMEIMLHSSRDKWATSFPRWRVIDGTGTIEEVSARIWQEVSLL